MCVENKKAYPLQGRLYFVERKGFEPLDLLQSSVFKTDAIDHSAISLCWSINQRYFINVMQNKHIRFRFPNFFKFFLLFFTKHGNYQKKFVNKKIKHYICTLILVTEVMNQLIKKLVDAEQAAAVRANIPAFRAGDTLNVHLTIREGGKERIQEFKGIVIQRRRPNSNGETFTIRKVSNGVGVERVLPLLSPLINKIELIKKGRVRRARLFYMRGKMGKSARVKDYIEKPKKEEVA